MNEIAGFHLRTLLSRATEHSKEIQIPRPNSTFAAVQRNKPYATKALEFRRKEFQSNLTWRLSQRERC